MVISTDLLHKANGRLQTLMYLVQLAEDHQAAHKPEYFDYLGKAKQEIHNLAQFLSAHVETKEQETIRKLNDR